MKQFIKDLIALSSQSESKSKERIKMAKFKVGDEVAVAAIMKISAIQPQSNGTVSYSTDRGITIPERLMEEIALSPKEQKSEEPKPEPKPAHRFKVGDRVVHRDHGIGTIIGYIDFVPFVPYLVKPDNDMCVLNHWSEAAVSPAPDPEPPKFYTGKVVCISGEYGVGRIFTVKDGFFADRQYNCPEKPYKSVDDMNDRFLFGKFAEAKE